jgi:hypothetical protein
MPTNESQNLKINNKIFNIEMFGKLSQPIIKL